MLYICKILFCTSEALSKIFVKYGHPFNTIHVNGIWLNVISCGLYLTYKFDSNTNLKAIYYSLCYFLSKENIHRAVLEIQSLFLHPHIFWGLFFQG